MARGILEIDGRRIELTDAQVEELLKGKEEEKNPFMKRPTNDGENSKYYYIDCYGTVNFDFDNSSIDVQLYNVANYCTDRKLMEQRALHEVLDRLLWRFSMENDGDKIDWDNVYQDKYKIYFGHVNKEFYIDNNQHNQYGAIYFHEEKIAKRAIKEIIEPFMEKHPEFVW